MKHMYKISKEQVRDLRYLLTKVMSLAESTSDKRMAQRVLKDINSQIRLVNIQSVINKM